MVRTLLLVAGLSLLAVPSARAQIFLELAGQTQGSIRGDAAFPGQEETIEISSFGQGMVVFVNESQGTIQRSRTDVTVSKDWDSSSIKLLRAQGEEEVLTTCVFRFYRLALAATTDPTEFERRMPMEELYLTVELVGARISSYSASSAAGTNANESLSLTFAEIRYTYVPTGETFIDRAVGPGAREALTREAPTLEVPRHRSPFGEGFDFVLPEDGPVDIEIVDADGRWVNTLYDDDATGSGGLVRWDATDADGRKVPAGVYTATVRTSGAEIVRRMVIGG